MANSVINPWPRRIGLTIFGLIIIGLSLALLLCLWIGSDRGRAYVESRVEAMTFSGQSVELDGLDGALLDVFTINELRLSGRDGVWLIARDVTIDWSPRAILSGTLDVNSLRVADLDLLQNPVLIPGISNEDPLVTRISIDQFKLPDVLIAETIARREIALSANGQFSHGTEGGSIVLSAQSDQGDTIEADLDWSPLLVLSGTADVDGPPAGLFASLLQLDDAQGVTADIQTEDTQTQITVQTGGALLADLRVQRRQASVGVGGTLDPARLPALESVLPWLGGSVRFDGTWPLDEGAAASLSLEAPQFVVEASGQQTGEAILIERLQLTSQDPLQGFELNGTTLRSIEASGQAVWGDISSFDGQIDARGLTYRDYQVDRLSGPASLQFDDGSLQFDLGLTGKASQSALQRIDGAVVAVVGTYEQGDGIVTLSRANVRLPGLVFSGRGQLALDNPGETQLNGQYQVDTHLFRPGPAAQLTGQVTARRTAAGVTIDLSGQTSQITDLPDAIAPFTERPIDYRARLNVSGGEVRIPSFEANSTLFTATGTANWKDGRIAATADYSAPAYDYGAVSARTISGRTRIAGPADRLAFETELGIDRLETTALMITQTRIDASGTYESGLITANGTIEASSEQGPVSASGAVSLDDGAWTITELSGQLGDLRTAGTMAGTGGDLSALRADIRLSGSSPLLPTESIEGTVRLGDLRADIDVVLSGLSYGPIQDGEVRLIADGPRDAVRFTVAGTGTTLINTLERPSVLDATGLADLSAGAIVAQAAFDLGVGSQALNGNVALQQRNTGWAMQLDGNGLGGRLEASLDPATRSGFSFDMDRVSVPDLARLLARPATEGTVSGRGRFLFIGEQLQGQATLSLDDLRSPISEAPPVSVLSRVELASEQLMVTLEAIEGGLSGQAVIAGPVMTGRQAPYLQWPPVEPLEGQAVFDGEIGPLVEIFLPPRTDVAGRVESDVRFTVPVSRRDIVGRVAIRDGQFEQGALGLRLRAITMEAELTGESIIVPTLSAEGVDGGSLSGSGELGLQAGMGTVDIQASRLRVIDRGEGQAEVSGDLSLSRTAELLRLTGELRVTDADINIARLPKPGLPTLDVSFGDSSDEDQPPSFASASTELDVSVLSNNRIKVRGRGLDANMGLRASVTGPFDNPVVTGEMTIDRGRFDFLGKRFELRDSSVLLRDDILQSILALEAVRSTSDLTAVVQVTGTLERPEIDLTSEPTLPEDEVLSRVIFGRSPTQLSAIETARLAAALTQLSGGSGFDLFGNLEDAIGLDTLEVGQSEAGQTQLTTGKYLSDDVYLEVRTAAEGTPGIAVEWQVRDNISLEAETQPNERQRLSVQWKKDFD
ncbi:MAG: translocation/assembly module TamB domain-containing protein [Pseudomonadota bacterium]